MPSTVYALLIVFALSVGGGAAVYIDDFVGAAARASTPLRSNRPAPVSSVDGFVDLDTLWRQARHTDRASMTSVLSPASPPPPDW